MKSARNDNSSSGGKRQLPGELDLIAAIRSRSRKLTSDLHLGIGDDCALLSPKNGEQLAITTDFTLENVHFRRIWHTPESVGHRCLARGLSDIAAMGARPVAAFLSIALPDDLTVTHRKQKSWIERFLDGLLALAARYDLPLAGGDTAESPSGLVAADIILVGAIKKGQALLRSTAHPGDFIYVTGSLGGAAAELVAIERNPRKFNNLKAAAPEHPHLYPEPRIVAGIKLAAKRRATACIDLSDGLSTDLQHICEESGLNGEIIAATIPIHPMAQLAEAAGWTPSALDLALNGGEDYELLFTAPPKAKVRQQIGGVPIHLIGKMKPKQADLPTVTLLDTDGVARPLRSKGWQHFAR